MDDAASLKSGSRGSTASSGTKRKRSNEVKYYAVRVGFQPVKSFSTLTDAERFVAGENPAQDGISGLSQSPKFYAVKIGKKPGIYTDWPSAQEQITGCQKPKHRCFTTRSEAQRFLDEEDSGPTDEGTGFDGDSGISVTYHASNGQVQSEKSPHPSKKAKKGANGTKSTTPYNEADNEPGVGPLPPDAEDGFDPNIILDPESGKVVFKTQEQRQATKSQPSSSTQTEAIRIHTDGSSLRNGQNGAYAGVGVFFGPGDKRNVSETLSGSRQTNQRAELTAILKALELVPKNRNVIVITDSKYAIDCVTSWHVNWRKNGWKTSAGKAVENKDIIENVLTKIEERDKLKVQTAFEWIKGHANHEGNVEADKLAVDGAKKGFTS